MISALTIGALCAKRSANDPLIASVQLMSHLENSTATTDTPVIDLIASGAFGASGFSPMYGTGHSKWGARNYIGTASNGTNYGPSGAVWHPGSGDWAIELWVYPTVLSSNNCLWCWSNNSNTTGASIYFYYTSNGALHAYTGSTMSVANADVIVSAAGIVTTGAYHFAQIIKSSGVLKLGWDGVQAGSNYTDPNNYTNDAMWGLAGAFVFNDFIGYCGELRYTRGATGTAGRTVNLPTGPFPST